MVNPAYNKAINDVLDILNTARQDIVSEPNGHTACRLQVVNDLEILIEDLRETNVPYQMPDPDVCM